MRRIVMMIAAACLLAGNADPVSDQVVVRDYFEQYSASNDRATLRQLAFCIADRYPDQAREAIRRQATTAMFKKKFPNLLDYSCLKPSLFKTKSATILDGYYQQLLAERLLLDHSGLAALPVVAHVPALSHPHLPEMDIDKIPEQYVAEFQLNWAAHRFDMVADCVARANPGDTLAIARTAPDSSQEKAAFSALDAAITGCGLTSAARDIPLYVWRGMLLENLYRLIDAAGSVQSEAGKSDAQG